MEQKGTFSTDWLETGYQSTVADLYSLVAKILKIFDQLSLSGNIYKIQSILDQLQCNSPEKVEVAINQKLSTSCSFFDNFFLDCPESLYCSVTLPRVGAGNGLLRYAVIPSRADRV